MKAVIHYTEEAMTGDRTALKTCNCGNVPQHWMKGATHIVLCARCGSETLGEISREAATEAWNRRLSPGRPEEPLATVSEKAIQAGMVALLETAPRSVLEYDDRARRWWVEAVLTAGFAAQFGSAPSGRVSPRVRARLVSAYATSGDELEGREG